MEHVARMGEMRNVYRYKMLFRKPEHNRTLESTRHRWVEILNWILKKTGFRGGVNLNGSEQGSVVVSYGPLVSTFINGTSTFSFNRHINNVPSHISNTNYLQCSLPVELLRLALSLCLLTFPYFVFNLPPFLFNPN
jgi:hypothetical protein